MSDAACAESREGRSRKALVLGGGGILGAAWELGALAAIEDQSGSGSIFREFDIFVGTSAGSFVAALLAQGIPPAEIFEGVLSDHPLYRLNRGSLYSLDLKRLGRALRGLMTGLLGEALEHVRRRRLPTLLGLSFSLQERVPAGFFRLDPLDHYLCRIFEARGISNRFADLSKELFIVALDLGAARRVVFGGSPCTDPTICEAITASSAIPRLFGPVQIGKRHYVDGAIGGDAYVDLAVDRGARHVLLLNPFVPSCPEGEEAPPEGRRPWPQGGLGAVLDRSLRIAHATAFRCSAERAALLDPEVHLVLLEPDPKDALPQNAMDLTAVPNVLRLSRDSVGQRLAHGDPDLSMLLVHKNASATPRTRT